MSNYYGYDYWRADSCLEHHGIKGQKWGVRRTPEELGHILANKTSRLAARNDANTAKIKKLMGDRSYDQLSDKEKAKVQSYMNKIAKNVSKSEKTTKKYTKKITKSQESLDKFKKDLINKGSRQDILNNKELFTTQELNDIANRKATEERLAGPNKLEKITSAIDKGTKFVNAGINAYDSVSKIKKFFDESAEKTRAKGIEEIIKSQDAKAILNATKNMKSSEVEEAKKRLTNLNVLKNFVNASQTNTTNKPENNQKQNTPQQKQQQSTPKPKNDTSQKDKSDVKKKDENKKSKVTFESDVVGKQIINNYSSTPLSSITKNINLGTDKRYNYGGIFRRQKNSTGNVELQLNDIYSNVYVSDLLKKYG